MLIFMIIDDAISLLVVHRDMLPNYTSSSICELSSRRRSHLHDQADQLLDRLPDCCQCLQGGKPVAFHAFLAQINFAQVCIQLADPHAVVG